MIHVCEIEIDLPKESKFDRADWHYEFTFTDWRFRAKPEGNVIDVGEVKAAVANCKVTGWAESDGGGHVEHVAEAVLPHEAVFEVTNALGAETSEDGTDLYYAVVENAK